MNNNNNNNNTLDNVYSAVIVIVHPVHLMNVDQCQVAADPQTKPTDFSYESTCRLLLSTSTIVIYCYSARKLILISPSHEGWVDLGTQSVRNLPKVFTQQWPGQESNPFTKCSDALQLHNHVSHYLLLWWRVMLTSLWMRLHDVVDVFLWELLEFCSNPLYDSDLQEAKIPYYRTGAHLSLSLRPVSPCLRDSWSAKHMVTFSVTQHHCILATSKFYCLVTEAYVCEQLTQGRYMKGEQPGVEPATSWSQVYCPNYYIVTTCYCFDAHEILNHLNCGLWFFSV